MKITDRLKEIKKYDVPEQMKVDVRGMIVYALEMDALIMAMSSARYKMINSTKEREVT